MKNKTLFLLLSLFVSGLYSHSESNRLKLKIPVRIIRPNKLAFREIQKNSFNLYINNQPVQIADITSRKISLSEESTRGRHFFLSFQICNLDRRLKSTISHFLTGILNQKDSLHVMSPVKIHSIPVSGNKGAILDCILQIIKTECLPFNQTRQVHETKIEKEIQHLNRIFNDTRRLIVPTVSLDRFIENLNHLFSRYKTEFLSLDMLRYQDLQELFLTLKDDRWWFHFQQNRTLDFIDRFNRKIQLLRQYRYYPLLKTIAQIQNDIKPSQLLPFDSIREIMVENRIRFLVLLTDDAIGSQIGMSGPFQRICSQSGGAHFKILSPSSAFKKIKIHQDSFFEITCHISPEPEARQVLIMLDQDQHQLVYKHRFSQLEIANLLASQAESKITISDISILNNKLTFVLNNYKINISRGFGLIKIQLKFTTTGDRIIDSAENILRASRDQTRISVPLPSCPEPVLNLTITASDLLANHSLQTRYQVYVDEHVPLVLPLKGIE